MKDNVQKNEVQKFDFKGHPVRVEVLNDQPWFVAKDVCDALGLMNARKAVADLEKEDLTSLVVTSGGQRRKMNVVSEFGAYDLVLTSRKPEAKAFKRWLTHEVVPTLGRTGSYSTMSPENMVNDLMEVRKDYTSTPAHIQNIISKAIESDYAQEIARHVTREHAFMYRQFVFGMTSTSERIQTIIAKKFGGILIDTYKDLSGYDLRKMHEETVRKGTADTDLWKWISSSGHEENLYKIAKMWEV